MGSNVGSEILLYIYGAVCVSMIAFNIVYNIMLGHGEKKLKQNSRRLEAEIYVQIHAVASGGEISADHMNLLKRKLYRVKNMLTLDDVLNRIEGDSDAYADGAPTEKYMESISHVIVGLSDTYMNRDNLQAAFFAYFISKHKIWSKDELEKLSGSMMKCLKKDSFYCKINAMQALCALADDADIIRALEIESRSVVPIHEKILTEILMDFNGDHRGLISELWEDFDNFSQGVQLAVLNYIRFKSGEWKDEMFSIMMDESRDKELRFSCMRYFAKYPWEKARKPLIDFTLTEDETKWEGAAICASAISSYPGEDVNDALMKAVHSRNWYVRYNAAESLQKLGAEYENLLDIISGDDRYAREMVMFRLEEREMMQEGGQLL